MADETKGYLTAFAKSGSTCVSSNFYTLGEYSIDDCARACYDALRCNGFGYLEENGSASCILQDIVDGECRDGRVFDLVYKLADGCAIETLPQTDCEGATLKTLNQELRFAPYPTNGECRLNDEQTTDVVFFSNGEYPTIEACRSACLAYSEPNTSRPCLGIEFRASNGYCEFQLGETNSVGQTADIVCEKLLAPSASTCRVIAAADTECGNTYVFKGDTGTCQCITNGLNGSTASQCAPVASGVDTTLAKRTCSTLALPPGETVGTALPTQGTGASDGLPVEMIGVAAGVASLVVVAVAAIVRSKRNRNKYNSPGYIGLGKLPSEMHSEVRLSAISEQSIRSSGGSVGPKPPKSIRNAHKQVMRESKWPGQPGNTQSVASTASFVTDRSTSQFFSNGTSFFHRMGISLRDLGVRASTVPLCQCHKKRPVAYDDLTHEQLKHVCGLKRLNRTGPRDALVLRLLLDEDKKGIPTCRQCLFSIDESAPQQPAKKTGFFW